VNRTATPGVGEASLLRYRAVCCAGLLAALSAASPAGAQATSQERATPLWGTLEPGPHAVGFRTLLLYDPSRPALPSDDGTPPGPEARRRGRQMAIFLWYPARAGGGAPLRVGDYVDLLARAFDFAPLDSARRTDARRLFARQAADLGGDTVSLRAALPAILRLTTAARANAPAAAGRHPLVLFPEYRAPATNGVMAEYLASHGFVVASSRLAGTFEADPDISTRGLETQAADLRFVLAALDSVPFVDRGRLAAMGVGITASGALAFQMRTPEVDAFVSLEGGVTTEGEIEMLRRSPYFDVAAARVPMLAIHAPHPDVDANRLDLYRYSTRHLVHFPGMGEFWFLDYGPLERHAPRIIGAPPGDVAAGFAWAARWVRGFLRAQLAGDSAALAALLAGPPPGPFTAERREGLPAPPPLSGLRALVRRDGVPAVVALYRARRPRDPQPIPAEHLADLASRLGREGRDPDWSGRRALAELRVESDPASARAHFALGSAALQAGDTAAARRHLAEALRLLPADPDPTLGPAARDRLAQRVREALARVGQ